VPPGSGPIQLIELSLPDSSATSASTIIVTRSSKPTVGVQPSFASAFAGVPISRST
jgi:hypothetical protein